MSLSSERRALVERAFPGVTCSRVALDITTFEKGNDSGDVFPQRTRYSLAMCVKGPAELLIAHELVKRAEIDALPPSGKIYGLRRLPDGTYQASFSCWDQYDYDERKLNLVARELAAKIGIAHVPKETRRNMEFRGLRVWWHSCGGVVHVDWQNLQLQVQADRKLRTGTGTGLSA